MCRSTCSSWSRTPSTPWRVGESAISRIAAAEDSIASRVARPDSVRSFIESSTRAARVESAWNRSSLDAIRAPDRPIARQQADDPLLLGADVLRGGAPELGRDLSHQERRLVLEDLEALFDPLVDRAGQRVRDLFLDGGQDRRLRLRGSGEQGERRRAPAPAGRAVRCSLIACASRSGAAAARLAQKDMAGARASQCIWGRNPRAGSEGSGGRGTAERRKVRRCFLCRAQRATLY